MEGIQVPPSPGIPSRLIPWLVEGFGGIQSTSAYGLSLNPHWQAVDCESPFHSG